MNAASLSIVSILLVGLASTADPDLSLERGNRLYFIGSYADALDMYELARLEGGAAGTLAFNRGNCLFRLDRYGEALHAFLEAEKHLPRSSRVMKNIAVITDRLGNPAGTGAGFVDRLRRGAGWITAAEYGVLARLLLTLFFFAAAGAMWRRRLPAPRWLVLFLLPGLVFAGISELVDDGPRGSVCVVVKNAALVVNEPTSQGTALFSLREGEVVALQASRREWVRISDREGNRGWARDSAVRAVR